MRSPLPTLVPVLALAGLLLGSSACGTRRYLHPSFGLMSDQAFMTQAKQRAGGDVQPIDGQEAWSIMQKWRSGGQQNNGDNPGGINGINLGGAGGNQSFILRSR